MLLRNVILSLFISATLSANAVDCASFLGAVWSSVEKVLPSTEEELLTQYRLYNETYFLSSPPGVEKPNIEKLVLRLMRKQRITYAHPGFHNANLGVRLQPGETWIGQRVKEAEDLYRTKIFFKGDGFQTSSIGYFNPKARHIVLGPVCLLPENEWVVLHELVHAKVHWDLVNRVPSVFYGNVRATHGVLPFSEVGVYDKFISFDEALALEGESQFLMQKIKDAVAPDEVEKLQKVFAKRKPRYMQILAQLMQTCMYLNSYITRNPQEIEYDNTYGYWMARFKIDEPGLTAVVTIPLMRKIVDPSDSDVRENLKNLKTKIAEIYDRLKSDIEKMERPL